MESVILNRNIDSFQCMSTNSRKLTQSTKQVFLNTQIKSLLKVVLLINENQLYPCDYLDSFIKFDSDSLFKKKTTAY